MTFRDIKRESEQGGKTEDTGVGCREETQVKHLPLWSCLCCQPIFFLLVQGYAWVHKCDTCNTQTCKEQAPRSVQEGGVGTSPPDQSVPWMESSADMEAFPEPFTTMHVYTPKSSWLTSWISRTCIPFFSDIDTRALGCRGTSPCGWQ